MNDDEKIEPAAHPYRWAMLASLALLYFCFGLTVVSMAPLVGPITRDLGLSNSAMGGVMGAWPLIYIASAVPCGALLDRIGPRRAMVLGTLVIALSGILRGTSTDHLSLFLAVAVFGIGGPLLSIGAPKVISMWFAGHERGLAMGVYFTGNALGGIVTLSLTNSVLMPLMGGSWRAVLMLYAGMALLSGIVWLIVSSHAASRALEREMAAGGHGSQLRVIGELLSHPGVRVILLMGLGMFFFNHSLNNWLPELLRTGGMDPVSAGYWASIPTVVGMGAALLIPRLALPHRRFAMLFVLISCATAATLMLHFEGGGGLAAGLVLQGITRGTIGPIIVLMLMETKGVGARAMGSAGGLYFSIGEVGGVLGPLTVGYLSDVTGGFDAPLYMLTGVTVFLLAMLVTLRRVSR